MVLYTKQFVLTTYTKELFRHYQNKPYKVAVVTFNMKTTVCRESHFNAAHRLHNSKWSDERNKAVFGKCNNENYHGHNYDLIVKVTGDVDEETGYVMDMKILKELIEEEVIERFDHKNLNLDTEEFKELNPTAENIARIIYEKIRVGIDSSLSLRIKLYETKRNYVEYGE